ncbi:MAG: transporter substrate-binding domain-containing protein [Reyranella sp.]|uniref:transporter substrate-binding domain-containing protein n=1 Tax=Reyranella sp. TaxID=1929291 RepID=UPI001AC4EE90|nr:transporter substrate-binding domain-containing protein [Reyranella sp.]MBN9086152.1 transporter substrate-binding domain-containing protein [Reyranella sp.]
MRLRVLARLLLAVAALLAPLAAARAETPDEALEALLTEARQQCAQPSDRLEKILCGKRLRVGVRDYYPLFGVREGGIHVGFEPDIARALAERFGVETDFVRVNAATRIPLLGEDRIDLILATMGHTTQRDGQLRFIRPHYYQSETVVVGPKALRIGDWNDLATRTICVTVGNVSNAQMVSHNTRLMLFDEAGVLPDRLKDETCTLAAQDDSFFAFYFTDRAFAERFEPKFGFAQVPWGMGVTKTGSDKLARALDLLSQIYHRDGTFLQIALKHRIRTVFLEDQQRIWQRPDCNTADGSGNDACVLPALNLELKPTPFAASVTAFEDWVEKRLGIDITLPMLKTQSAYSLFLNGVANSLILIAGALVATFAFSILFGFSLGSDFKPLRRLAWLVTMTLQSSPIVLTLVIAAAFAHALLPYSAAVALGASILALGLTNGSNAGQAVSEAVISLHHEGGEKGMTLFVHALRRSATSIVAFLINAAKGTPAASFIGAPELLGALTDVSSFSSGRATIYCIVLIFYTVVVMIVVWACGWLRAWLEGRQVPA